MDAIRTMKLTKSYGKNRGIDGIDLAVKQGEFFGFMGPNGSGKSTTIRTLLGLISPNKGRGEILGYDIVKDKVEILKNVGYLPSEAIFYQGMKVKDIIKLAADLRKSDCQKEAMSLCKRLELDVNRKVDELSFGNRKKVAIVCALQHDSKLLVLDEPTSGLDPLMQKIFFEILHERNQQGTTIFMSSHVLSEIQQHCTRAAIIKEGKIIACEDMDELIKSNAKKVIIHGDVDLKALSNIRLYQSDHQITSFLYQGDINQLLLALTKYHIKDIVIEEPSLEEVFIHYYQGGGAYDDNQA